MSIWAGWYGSIGACCPCASPIHVPNTFVTTQVTCATLPPLPALAHLEVPSTDTDDLGLQALEQLPALQRLSLADCMQVRSVLNSELFAGCGLTSWHGREGKVSGRCVALRQ